MPTRFVKLANKRSGEAAQTVCLSSPAPIFHSFRLQFIKHYQTIRELLTRHEQAGLGIFAADQSSLAAAAWLSAKASTVNEMVIGRHKQADLLLPDDPTLSLRHLLLLCHPSQREQDLRFRLVDLRTSTAFYDERGNQLQALEAEGPLFVSCGRYSLFVLPTQGEPWPEQPEEAWEGIPERVYFSERPAETDRWQRQPSPATRPVQLPEQFGHSTLVRICNGPDFGRHVLHGDDEETAGRLRLRSSKGSATLAFGHDGLEQGILLGRYHRCESTAAAVLEDRNVSRVHLLVIEIDDEIYAVDLASTNGTWLEDRRIRALKLSSGTELALGDFVQLQWVVGPRSP